MLDPRYPKQEVLIGEIDQSYLWGNADSLDPEIQLCVFDEFNRALFCSHQEYEPSPEELIKLKT